MWQASFLLPLFIIPLTHHANMRPIHSHNARAGVGFGDRFFDLPVRKPDAMPEQANAQPRFRLWNPMTWNLACQAPRLRSLYYNPVTHGSIEQFTRSTAFPGFRLQLNKSLDDIVAFYESHRPQDKTVREKFDEFRAHLFSDYFSSLRSLFYDQGKQYIEEIARGIRDESIRLDKRLDVVANLAPGVTVCAGGSMSNLQDAVAALSTREENLASHVLGLKQALLDDAILDFANGRHRYDDTSEIHYANAYQQKLALSWGVPARSDAFASLVQLSDDDLHQCQLQAATRITPARLASVLADQFLQEMREIFEKHYAGEQRPIPFDTPEARETFQAFREKSIPFSRRLANDSGTRSIMDCSWNSTRPDAWLALSMIQPSSQGK
jgi:hypothetical protein